MRKALGTQMVYIEDIEQSKNEVLSKLNRA